MKKKPINTTVEKTNAITIPQMKALPARTAKQLEGRKE
jgi:hypothetical protein